jgi:hypothetical protein
MKSEPTLLLSPKTERRHDLDALRAIAMLLGIVLHGLMPFIGLPEFMFPIQDVSQMPVLGMILSGIHGFRMPLFFLISGFFTTMLWRRRGLKALIQHRFKRIFLPLMLGLITIVPLTDMVTELPKLHQNNATLPSAANDLFTLVQNDQSQNVFSFIKTHNESEMKSLLASGVSPDTRHPKGYTALNATVYANAPKLTKLLLEYGANPNLPSLEGDNNTALMESAFWGQSEIFGLLLAEGADLSLTNSKGANAVLLATVDINLARDIAQLIGLRLTIDQIADGRREVLVAINQALEKNPNAVTPRLQSNQVEIKQLTGDSFAPQEKAGEDILTTLMYIPIFHHLWFLWYLCCLVAAFSLWALAADKLQLTFPRWLIMPPVCFLWLLPLTYFFQNLMGHESGSFGPDTATGLIPVPAIIGFYSIFFFYGAWYYDCDDSKGELGKYWWFSLPIAQLLIHPIGLEFASGDFGFRHELASFEHYRLLSVLFQIAYVWLMTTGCLGLFRKFFNHESKRMRYISDSSYWLYVAHIPLLFLLQYLVSTLEISALIKAPVTIILCSILLLISYEYCVRYTPLGTLLNGAKTRPGQIPATVASVMPATTTPVDLSKYKSPTDDGNSSSAAKRED